MPTVSVPAAYPVGCEMLEFVHLLPSKRKSVCRIKRVAYSTPSTSRRVGAPYTVCMSRPFSAVCSYHMRRGMWPRAKHIVTRAVHSLLQPNHVGGDFHDRSKRRERAAPPGVQRGALEDHLRNEVLHPRSVVLNGAVEFELLRRQRRGRGLVTPPGWYLTYTR